MRWRRAAQRGGIATGWPFMAGLLMLASCSSTTPAPSVVDARVATSAPASRSAEAFAPVELSAHVQNLIGQLSSSDGSVRMQAMSELAKEFQENAADTDYLNQLVERVRVNIGAQLEIMMSDRGPEAAAQVKRVLVYNQGLANFAAAALDAQPAEREMLLQWGLSRDRHGVEGEEGTGTQADLASLAFSAEADDRARAAKALGLIHHPAADWILARMIDDPNRWVSLAAMNAVWDRSPTPAVVNVLWNKAVIYPLAQFGYRPMENGLSVTEQTEQTKMIQVGDRTLQLENVAGGELGLKMLDGDVATDILVAYKSPLVEKKLDVLFGEMLNAQDDPNSRNYRNYALSPNYGGSGANLRRLVEAYRPRSAIILLIQLATSGTGDGADVLLMNQPFRYSGRIDAMGMLCHLTDLNRDDLKLIHRQDFGNRWVIAGRAEDEEAAARKVREWWRVHQQEYAGK